MRRYSCLIDRQVARPMSSRALPLLRSGARAISDGVPLSVQVYVSEGRSPVAISQLEATARACGPHAALAHLFVDEPYNRSNFTLVSRHADVLVAATLALARQALLLVDMRRHAASHPRLGALDHVSVHPLLGDGDSDGDQGLQQAASSLAAAAELARAIARQLGEGLQLPAYLYGAAHEEGRQLADLRRQLGYFRGSAGSAWQGQVAAAAAMGAGASASAPAAELPVSPDFGPLAAAPRGGVCCVGAVPFITNYNVLLQTDDLAAARRVARAAMALRHEGGIEVACNLLDGRRARPEDVLERLQQLVAAEGIEVDGEGYTTGKRATELLALVRSLP